MEASNIKTAAAYVNNLLLARGLLRNGKPAEFSELATYVPQENKHRTDSEPVSAPTVVADIINLVHDMVLKRDRDQEQRESLTFTLRSLQTDASRNTAELEKLKQRNQELRRQISLFESSQRTAETAAKGAEVSAKALREEVAKTKGLLAQVRAQCANDIRKRDVQIQGLKKHLSERQRGNKASVIGPSITIRPGSTGMAAGADGYSGLSEDSPNLQDEEYSLKQETTEFLTQLSQNLSDENDSLIALIRGTITTLRELQGLPHNQTHKRSGSHLESRTQQLNDSSEDLVHVSELSHQVLATDLESVLSNLTELLTNPSFAPIEEVHVREEEIQRLREGWERMESRWHEAIAMMKRWRKRMLRGGDNVKLDELKMGLCLGEGLDSPSRSQPNALNDIEGATESKRSERDSSFGEEFEDLPIIDDLPSVEDDIDAEEKPMIEVINGEEDDLRPALFKSETTNVLQEISVNKDSASARRRPEVVTTGVENSSPLPDQPKSKAISSSVNQSRPHKSRLPSRQAPVPTTRVTQPARSSPAPEPTLSVEEKLQIADKEARSISSSSPSKLNKSADDGCTKKASVKDHGSSRVGSLRDQSKGKGGSSPVKRARIAGRPKRRKSTLSPEELEVLMMGR